MAMSEVLFIGTGNAFAPSGRMHASVILDGEILIDCPTTILPQLRRFKIKPYNIRHLMITHWHGDHIFGFPFLMLDREWMTPENEDKRLIVHCRAGGEERLTRLCELGFPGSLEDSIENHIEWVASESSELSGSEWSFNRFPVVHTIETDPHGYELNHSSGLRILHCGDSGPCEEIEKRAGESGVVILEMGVPDFVESPNHHNPKQVVEFSERHPHATILVTHSFTNSEGSTGGFEIPSLPEKVIQVEDGDSLIIDEEGDFLLIRKNDE